MPHPPSWYADKSLWRYLPPPERLALLRPGALGDALLAFPTLAWLRRTYPNTRVLFVARAEVLPLARDARLAAETRDFDDPVWSALWREPDDASTTEALRQALGGADAVMAWLNDPEARVECMLGAAGVMRAVVVPGQPPADAHEHVARHLMQSLTALGLYSPQPDTWTEIANITPRLTALGAAAREADALWQAAGLAAARVVALHPGSGSAAKCWPAEHFAALAGELIRAAYVPLIIEGPADEAVVARLLAAGPEMNDGMALAGTEWPPPVARGLSVAALADVLGCCTAYVGNDSGVSHLAALTGCPTLVLFGPTYPSRWLPIGVPDGRTVDARRAADGNMAGIPVDYVWSCLRRILPR